MYSNPQPEVRAADGDLVDYGMFNGDQQNNFGVMTNGSSSESHASTMLNSRFWFDMYQRLKSELERERNEFLTAQAQFQMEREEEASLARQRISVLINEKDILQKLSEEHYVSL